MTGQFFNRDNVGLGSLSCSPSAGSVMAIREHERIHAFSLGDWTRKKSIHSINPVNGNVRDTLYLGFPPSFHAFYSTYISSRVSIDERNE